MADFFGIVFAFQMTDDDKAGMRSHAGAWE